MLLNVKQRLLLLNIIPGEGDYLTLKIIREQQGYLGFSDEELQRLNVQKKGDTYTWDEEKDMPVDIPIGEMAFAIIKRELVNLDGQGLLRVEFLPLYEHFVEGEDWPPRE